MASVVGRSEDSTCWLMFKSAIGHMRKRLSEIKESRVKGQEPKPSAKGQESRVKNQVSLNINRFGGGRYRLWAVKLAGVVLKIKY